MKNMLVNQYVLFVNKMDRILCTKGSGTSELTGPSRESLDHKVITKCLTHREQWRKASMWKPPTDAVATGIWSVIGFRSISWAVIRLISRLATARQADRRRSLFQLPISSCLGTSSLTSISIWFPLALSTSAGPISNATLALKSSSVSEIYFQLLIKCEEAKADKDRYVTEP